MGLFGSHHSLKHIAGQSNNSRDQAIFNRMIGIFRARKPKMGGYFLRAVTKKGTSFMVIARSIAPRVFTV